jgi:2'-5' RNA ligase
MKITIKALSEGSDSSGGFITNPEQLGPKLKDDEPIQKHSYGTVQIDLPTDLVHEIQGYQAIIPADYLGVDGHETRPHITVRYGLLPQSSDIGANRKDQIEDGPFGNGWKPDLVADALQGIGPVNIKLGKISHFPAKGIPVHVKSGTNDQDAIYIAATSDGLIHANEALASLPHVSTQPQYVPHVTLFYGKPGIGKQYEGGNTFEGREFTADKVTLIDQDGNETQLHLSGEAKKSMKKAITIEVGDDASPLETGIIAVLEALDNGTITDEAAMERLAGLANTADPTAKAYEAFALKFADGSDEIVQGIGVPYGGPMAGNKDLHGEAFSKATNLCPEWFGSKPDATGAGKLSIPILYHHGLDETMKAEKVNTVPVGYISDYKTTDKGVWYQGQLSKSNEYHKEVAQLIKDGKAFFSTSAPPHLVVRDTKGNIETWPVVEVSLTPTPANMFAKVEADMGNIKAYYKAVGLEDPTPVLEAKALWSTAYKNDLPDSSFLYIKPGGKKDDDGKTVPRDLRMFPVKDKDGKPDEPHVKDALGRIPQAKGISDDVKADCLNKAKAMAKKLGVEVADDKDGKTKSVQKGWVKDWMMDAKAIFDELMENEKLDPWYLFRMLMCGASDIDDVIDASQGSPIQIDGEALVDELIAGFVPLLKPALMRVVYDEQSGMDFDGDSSVGGWMRSDSLLQMEKFRIVVKAMGDGACVKGLPLLDHISAVLAANEEVGQRFKTASERRATDSSGNKTGRTLSKDTQDKMRGLADTAASIHNSIHQMLGNPDTLPYAPKPAGDSRMTANGDKKDDEMGDNSDASMASKMAALNLQTLASSLELQSEQAVAD